MLNENNNFFNAIKSDFFSFDNRDEISAWFNKAFYSHIKWNDGKGDTLTTGFQYIDCVENDFPISSIPEHGSKYSELISILDEKIIEKSVRVNHPKYIGHMTQALPWYMPLLDFYIGMLNQNQVKVETALSSTCIEKEVIQWLYNLFYSVEGKLHSHSENQPLGTVVNGGTVGNLTALSVALEKALPNVRKLGLNQALCESGYKNCVLIGSELLHYSIKKAASTLGLGEQNVVLIPVDENHKIRVDILKKKIAQLNNENIKVIAVIGLCGSTETGSIDPLIEVSDIAKDNNIWFHVDAAWGGALAISNKHRGEIRGIENADSIVVDGHKFFWTSMSQGYVIFKNVNSLSLIQHNANYIIREGSSDLGQYSLEGSRRFDALKTWFNIMLFGRKGYEELINNSVETSILYAKLIGQNPNFELVSQPSAAILTYRISEKFLERNADEFSDISIDEITNLTYENQKRLGNSFTSKTLVHHPNLNRKVVVFRVVTTNLLTNSKHLEEVLIEQEKIACEILEERCRKTVDSL